MNIRSLTTGLEYKGAVKGKRQTYYVFEGRREFLVMSFSRAKANAGNFNVVSRAAVQYVGQRFGGRQGLTAKIVSQKSRKPRMVRNPLAALNILYVLVAIGRATIDTRRQREPQIYFNVKKRSAAH